MTRLTLTTLLCSAWLAGCSSGFESGARVQKLRLLAIAADHPDALPGDDVRLDVLYADPQQRPIQWGFALCEQPPSSTALDCALSLDTRTLQLNDSPVFDFSMPPPHNDTDRESAVGVVVVACPGEISAGSTLGIPVQCMVDGAALDLSHFELGVKRVFFRDSDENHNPQLGTIYFDGTPWDAATVPEVLACDRARDDLEKCPKDQQHTLSVEAPDARETYHDQAGTPVREQVVAQFYGSGGRFEFDARTLDDTRTRWAARVEDSASDLTLYFVVRDNRGGVSFEVRQVYVR